MRRDSPTTPHWGQVAVSSVVHPRCSSRNSTAAASSEQTAGIFLSRGEDLRVTVGIVGRVPCASSITRHTGMNQASSLPFLGNFAGLPLLSAVFTALIQSPSIL